MRILLFSLQTVFLVTAIIPRFRNIVNRISDNFIGCTPMKYVSQCRITKAKEYLCNGFSVDDTCRLTGFHNLSHFSYLFKKETGLRPKKYAENQKK